MLLGPGVQAGKQQSTDYPDYADEIAWPSMLERVCCYEIPCNPRNPCHRWMLFCFSLQLNLRRYVAKARR